MRHLALAVIIIEGDSPLVLDAHNPQLADLLTTLHTSLWFRAPVIVGSVLPALIAVAVLRGASPAPALPPPC